jgi:hypothetical protein
VKARQPHVVMSDAGFVISRQFTHSNEVFNDEFFLTKEDFEAINELKKRVYFISEIEYTDVIGYIHVTREGVYFHREKGALKGRLVLIPGEQYNYAT